MTVHIAHLSDLHFGSHFNVDVWKGVVFAVTDFRPQVIVVSGDLVDHPSPAHLLAAKCELHALAAAAQAELCIVPGNHDMFEYGTGVVQVRHTWFERIFGGGNTADAEALLRQSLAVPALGFTVRCRDATSDLWSSIKTRFGVAGFAEALPPAPPRLDLVRRPPNVPILFALLDSNPDGPGDLATGVVSDEQLNALARELAGIDTAYLARIAVVHHHVLPVAYAGRSRDRQESAMVLRNAGTVLRVLADHRFDLVLHGHWHLPQYARLDFATAGSSAYPLAVAAAGSAAMDTSDPNGNAFNLITIDDSGRITVQSVLYGAANAPRWRNTDGSRIYGEPIRAVKRRALARASERHLVASTVRRQECEITENGDLWMTYAIEGLRLCKTCDRAYRTRPHTLQAPPYGRFVRKTLKMGTAAGREGYRFDPDDGAALPHGALRCVVRLPDDLKSMKAAEYEFEYACANSITMTRWEAAERRRRYGAEPLLAPEGDQEWIGTGVAHPTDTLRLRLRLPDSLGLVVPYVRCLRLLDTPEYKINEVGDVDLLAALAKCVPVPDEEAARDAQLLFNNETRTWEMKVEQPIVGYHYQLCWELPGVPPHDLKDGPRLQGETQETHKLLLGLAARIAAGQADDPADHEAIQAFDLFRTALEKQFSKGRKSESRSVELWTYDAETLTLRPVLSYRSWSQKPWPLAFKIPLGDGIAGAAFQQRRFVPWGRNLAPGSLIEPSPSVPPEGEAKVDMEYMVGIPLYHPEVPDPPRPPPWATIGVVSFSSSSTGSRLAGLTGAHPDPAMQRLVLAVRALAQKLVTRMTNVLQ